MWTLENVEKPEFYCSCTYNMAFSQISVLKSIQKKTRGLKNYVLNKMKVYCYEARPFIRAYALLDPISSLLFFQGLSVINNA